MFHITGRAFHISKSDFVHMCPTIIYQLDAHLCHPQIHVGCHADSVNSSQHCRTYHGLLAADRPRSEGRGWSSFKDLTGAFNVTKTKATQVNLAWPSLCG